MGGYEVFMEKYMKVILIMIFDGNIIIKEECYILRVDFFYIFRDFFKGDLLWFGFIFGLFIFILWYWCID